ncbi:putative dehydrogenase [Bradyrhizobium sp. S3.12.5]|uniref:hypothetical protein n=1 Tax=Bradyrhizobium sp. S3.12.5 TaxID=3156386 RepID=UPI003391B2CF
MKVGILGSGFGLYGYLPAIIRGCGERVLLPERYRSRFLTRQDVVCLAENIEWLPDERTVLDAASAVIIARRPEDQVHLVDHCLARRNIRRLLLEKPLAPSPEAAGLLIRRISAAGLAFRIGYAFRYTPWFSLLLLAHSRDQLREPAKLRWRFRAHHHRTGAPIWKRQISQGGGAIRFFGIHLIAMLAELGYDVVLTSEVDSTYGGEADCWRATFIGPALPAFHIAVETNAPTDEFYVACGEVLIQLPDPLSSGIGSGRFDRRVASLSELCAEFLYSETRSLPWYQSSIELWSKVELLTRRVPYSQAKRNSEP